MQLNSETSAIVVAADGSAVAASPAKVERVPDRTAVTAGIDAANAVIDGVRSHAHAVWQWLNIVGRIQDDETRNAMDGDFGAAFKSAYAASISKGSNVDGGPAARKALSRVRGSAKKVMKSEDWALLTGPQDLVAFGTQTDADQDAAKRRDAAARAGGGKSGGVVSGAAGEPSAANGKPIEGTDRQLLVAAFASFNEALLDVKITYPTGGAKHRFDATWAALRSEMEKLGFGRE